LLNASACALVIKRKSRPRVTSIRETLCCREGVLRSGRAEALATDEVMLLMGWSFSGVPAHA